MRKVEGAYSMTSQNTATIGLNNQPLVSIIMNCYNGEKYLREAIDSIFAQTYQNWEIIFWDNASTDSSGDIVKTFEDKRLKYFRGDINIPLGAARNEALDKTRGEFIAFLDTDDIWYPDKLSAQVACFKRCPEIDFIYTNLVCFGEGAKEKLFGRKKTFFMPQPAGMVFKKFLKRYPVNLQTVMMRHSSLKEMGEYFDSRLQVAEEFDLFMRFFYGRQVGYLHKVLAAYRLHPGQDSRTKVDLYAVEAEYVMKKLQQYFPDSKEVCKKEYEYFEAKIGYYRARWALRRGDKAAARIVLSRFRWRAWRFLALYIILFMPSNMFIFLHKLTGRYY